jgi:hypothetical protein
LCGDIREHPEPKAAGGTVPLCAETERGETDGAQRGEGKCGEHLYYRFANNHLGPEHPAARFNAEQLEEAIVGALKGLKLPNAEVTDWFRKALSRSLSNEAEY